MKRMSFTGALCVLVMTAAPILAKDGPIMSGFPAVDNATVNQVLRSASFTGLVTRSVAIGTFDGFSAHPVQLCVGNQKLAKAIFWSRTNRAGNRLRAATSYVGGEMLTIIKKGRNRENGANLFYIDRSTNTARHVCTIVKPEGGIAPLIRADCKTD